VYENGKILQRIREIVQQEKQARGIGPGAHADRNGFAAAVGPTSSSRGRRRGPCAWIRCAPRSAL
jgi:hypothetical protein